MALPRFFRPGVAWFSRTLFFRRVGPTIMPPLERMMVRLTNGRVQLSGLLLPSLVLHSVGAKTGLERDVTLMYCPEPVGSGSAEREQLLITGSNFARNTHPARLGPEGFDEICQRYAEGATAASLSAEFNVARNAIL